MMMTGWLARVSSYDTGVRLARSMFALACLRALYNVNGGMAEK